MTREDLADAVLYTNDPRKWMAAIKQYKNERAPHYRGHSPALQQWWERMRCSRCGRPNRECGGLPKHRTRKATG